MSTHLVSLSSAILVILVPVLVGSTCEPFRDRDGEDDRVRDKLEEDGANPERG